MTIDREKLIEIKALYEAGKCPKSLMGKINDISKKTIQRHAKRDGWE